jgi:hypothetical protein
LQDHSVGPFEAPCDFDHFDTLTHSSQLSLARWCSRLVTAVFRCRSSFAAFVRHSISLLRASKRSVSPAFPLPVPFTGVFAKMPSGLSSVRRARILFRRAVTLVTLALNFWWNGCRFLDDRSLTRIPSPAQRTIYGRICDLLQVDGPQDVFCVAEAGRKFPQLIARLGELSDAVTSLGVRSSTYDRTFEGFEVPADNKDHDQLDPYRNLDSSRILLHGRGHWDPTEIMSDTLAMAFRNPDILLFERGPCGCGGAKDFRLC